MAPDACDGVAVGVGGSGVSVGSEAGALVGVGAGKTTVGEGAASLMLAVSGEPQAGDKAISRGTKELAAAERLRALTHRRRFHDPESDTREAGPQEFEALFIAVDAGGVLGVPRGSQSAE